MANGKSYFVLKIDGMEGECPDPNYQNFMEIESWGWSVSMESTGQMGSGMAKGKAHLGEFSFVKASDKASVKLYEACATGKHIASAVCIGRKQGRESGELEEFVKYTFKELVVTHFGIMGGGAIPTESLAFAYEEVKLEYDQKLADGSSEGWKAAGFNSKTNKAA